MVRTRPRGNSQIATDGGVTLAWAGRRDDEPGGAASVESARFSAWEITGLPLSRDARLLVGDATTVATALAGEGLAGQVDLVYIDPPYGSQADYVHEARLDGPADGRVVRAPAYEDSAGVAAYLDMMLPALRGAAALLSPRGTLWVHLDWRSSYLVRVLLDEIMGRDAFLNEIVWRRAPNLGRQAASYQFGRTLDTILVYGGKEAQILPPTRLEPIDPKAIRFDEQGRPFTSAPRGDYTDESIARLDKEGRVHRTSSGKVYIKYFLVKDADGVLCRERRVDALWTDVPPLRHAPPKERTGFPTQKPRALLDRIVGCASPPGGLVVDLFCGSGTTGESAHALGRRFVLGDAGPMAVATARARLLRAGVELSIERTSQPSAAAAPAPAVTVERLPGGQAKVSLVSPREPLAWCIDTRHDPAGPFRVAWHSEREPGARPVPAARDAVVALDEQAVLAIRVYADDGSVATVALDGASDGSMMRGA